MRGRRGGHLAAQPRPRVARPPVRAADDAAEDARSGAAARSRVSCSSACAASSATAAAERGIGGARPRRRPPPAPPAPRPGRRARRPARWSPSRARRPGRRCSRRRAAPAPPRRPRAGCAGRSPAGGGRGWEDIAAILAAGTAGRRMRSRRVPRRAPGPADRRALAPHAGPQRPGPVRGPAPRPGGSLTTSPRHRVRPAPQAGRRRSRRGMRTAPSGRHEPGGGSRVRLSRHPAAPTRPPRGWPAGSSRSSATAGYDLEELVVTPAGRRSVVRVVVDRDEGVTLDDIAEVSRAVSEVLDAERRRHGPHAVRARGDQPRASTGR